MSPSIWYTIREVWYDAILGAPRGTVRLQDGALAGVLGSRIDPILLPVPPGRWLAIREFLTVLGGVEVNERYEVLDRRGEKGERDRASSRRVRLLGPERYEVLDLRGETGGRHRASSRRVRLLGPARPHPDSCGAPAGRSSVEGRRGAAPRGSDGALPSKRRARTA